MVTHTLADGTYPNDPIPLHPQIKRSDRYPVGDGPLVLVFCPLCGERCWLQPMPSGTYRLVDLRAAGETEPHLLCCEEVEPWRRHRGAVSAFAAGLRSRRAS